jgi:hypothetical protein
MLGGKCIRCGWSGNILAFQFHHREQKNFDLGCYLNRSWKWLLKELVKCDLLCSNCHCIEHHGGRDTEKFLAAVQDYRGSVLHETIPVAALSASS